MFPINVCSKGTGFALSSESELSIAAISDAVNVDSKSVADRVLEEAIRGNLVVVGCPDL